MRDNSSRDKDNMYCSHINSPMGEPVSPILFIHYV